MVGIQTGVATIPDGRSSPVMQCAETASNRSEAPPQASSERRRLVLKPSSPARQPGRVLVIGAGVTGLTTSLCLRGRGFDVTIVAEKFAPDIVSVVAGALWEWPPAVCGHHVD